MAKQDKNGSLWRWLSGELRRSEVQQLEKEAAGDPFLSDALEGFQDFPAADHLEKLSFLQKRIDQRVAQKRPTLMIWLPRLAAAALILVVGIIAIRFFSTPKDQSTIAQVEISKPSNKTDLEESLIEKNKEIAENLAPSTNEIAVNKPSFTKKNESILMDSISLPAKSSANDLSGTAPYINADEPASSPNAAFPSPIRSENNPARSVAAENAEKTILEKSEELPSIAEIKSRNANAVVSTVLAQTKLVDANGKPLIGVAVVIPAQNVTTYTDEDGIFSYAQSKKKKVEAQFYSHDGFSQVIIFNDDDNELTLNREDERKKELSAKKNPVRPQAQTIDIKADLDYPQPVGGITAWQRYLEKNLNAPAAANRENSGGSVTLSFEIDEKGVPKAFKTLKTQGNGCEEEAIKAIKNGPKWIGTKTNTRVIFSVLCHRS
jgi:hypothetical protein